MPARIAADANKQRSVPGEEWRHDAPMRVGLQEYLATSTMPPSAQRARSRREVHLAI
ncbi:MAG: hypothetical protein IPK28_20535 [Devosia sp.]|nr:hypothetical protein [Devosia sp.]